MKNFLFVQTNNPAGNQILAYDRADNGALARARAIDTGGDGGVQTTIDPLDSQGSLVYDSPHRRLIAVNAGRGNLYVADTGSNNLTGFHVDVAGKPTVFTQADTSSGPIDLIATRNGRFLYVQTGSAGGIDGFGINPDGTLTRILTLSGLDGLEGIAAT